MRAEHEPREDRSEFRARQRSPTAPSPGRAAEVLRLQRTVGNRATLQILRQHGRSRHVAVQRAAVVSDENEPSDLAAVIDAYVRSNAAPWLVSIIQSPRVHFVVNVKRASDERTYEGKTALAYVNGTRPQATQSVREWHALLSGAASVILRVDVWPEDVEDGGAVLSSVMHELYLHLRPMAASLDALRGSQLGDAAVQHLTTIVDGELAQHSDPAAWREYLSHAVATGRGYKDRGDLRLGSNLILATVNDLMTHLNPAAHGTRADRVPQMNQHDRAALFGEAGAIGTAEAEFQDEHPEIWPSDSDTEDDAAALMS